MKRKRQSAGPSTSQKKRKNADSNKTAPKSERCTLCKQYIEEVCFYGGHMNNSVEEFIALTDDKLSLFTGKEASIHEADELPTHKVTHFSVYDEKGHLCPFDSGLVEKNVLLFLSGYLKPIFEEDATPIDGIAAHDLGPINEWYISGFDGGEKSIVGIVTAYAHYVFMEPSEEYAPFVKTFNQKVALVKSVIEYLLDNCWLEPTYEDLLLHLESCNKQDLSEDLLLQHAQFVCDQICSFDEAGEEDEKSLIASPCVRTLVNLCGVNFRQRKKVRQLASGVKQSKNNNFTKAATTPLVRSIFENFFPDQIEIKDSKGPKKKRCGVCHACQSPDCGKCPHCKDMIKFGGSGRGKQACKVRRCPNMAIEDAELSETEEPEDVDNLNESGLKDKLCAKRSVNKGKWLGDPVLISKGKKFYNKALVAGFEVQPGDYVMLNPENSDQPLQIGKIEYMYDKFPEGPTIHAQLFCRGIDTILGETAAPQELFVVNICEDCPLGSIVRKTEVVFKKAPENWAQLGGIDGALPVEQDDHKFFASKSYDCLTASFTDYFEQNGKTGIDSCGYCWIQQQKNKLERPFLEDGSVNFLGESYRVGACVLLDPSTYSFPSAYCESTTDSIKSVDENIFPEYYRKTVEVKGSNENTPEPFCVGKIEKIWEEKSGIKLKIRMFYRPENTKGSVFLAYQTDINRVYWTAEVIETTFSKVCGKCYLRYCDNLESVSSWPEEGPYRFYFTEAYNIKTGSFEEVSDAARKIGYCGKGKGKSKSSKVPKETDEAPPWPKIGRPLRCMDVFAGCGGFSQGLHQSGVAETLWAIEKDVSAARAFKLNNKSCEVFTDDCNELLEQKLKQQRGSGRELPDKGEVEMLVGGPPCQGFSGMNRFNAGQYSLFKNSLVVSYLSYCDYYRPNYFVLENVRNFVTFKRSMVLKLALRTLLEIGYQVRFGVLQAGHYGVPQTRRRLILIAAAPGLVLPKLPEPQHVFSKRGAHLSFALDGVKFSNGNFWTESAPYRTICVRDAISDLPDIRNGWNEPEMPYDGYPQSHFQRKMRGTDTVNLLVDHVCKEMAPIVEARIANIPEIPGADWRDLPNIVVKLNDGTNTSKLRYPYVTKKGKKGVCRCALGQPCDPSDRQVNTLIPWCLPHTADRHNNWAGLYGRLEWDGFFGTTITNPEPMGKQGRVLHPEQSRVVSVRECARSQGFPDQFKFYGSLMDKHRQVGNAVPPPLGKALGEEIKKAWHTDSNSKF